LIRFCIGLPFLVRSSAPTIIAFRDFIYKITRTQHNQKFCFDNISYPSCWGFISVLYFK
jgi:hypothetical protein